VTGRRINSPGRAAAAVALCLCAALGAAASPGAAEPAPGQPATAPGADAAPPASAPRPAASPAPAEPRALTLAQAYRLALAQHPSVRARAGGVRVAEQELEAAQWLRYPSASVDAGAALAQGGGDGGGQRQGATLRVQQPLWDAGLTDARIGSAGLRRELARAEQAEAEQALLLRTSQAYVEQLRQHRRVEVAQLNLAEHQRLVDLMQRRAEQKVSSMADLALARSRWQQAQTEALAAAAGLQRSAVALEALIGRGLADAGLEAVPGGPAPELAAALEAAQRSAPTLARLRQEAAIARSEARGSEAATRPQVVLRYEHRLGSAVADVRGRLSLALEYQPGAGLSAWASARAAAQRIGVADEAVETARVELAQQLGDVHAELQSAAGQRAAAAEVAGSARGLVDSFLRQFTAGRKSWLEVLNTQREAATAATALIDIEAAQALAAQRLDILTGRIATPSMQALSNGTP
jgi:adhesin transport system outer membrane protein